MHYALPREESGQALTVSGVRIMRSNKTGVSCNETFAVALDPVGEIIIF